MIAVVAERAFFEPIETDTVRQQSPSAKSLYRYAYWLSLCPSEAMRLTRSILEYQQLGSNYGADIVTLLSACRSKVLGNMQTKIVTRQGGSSTEWDVSALRQAIASLDARDRELLALQKCLQLSLQQIAIVVCDSESYVRQRLAAIMHTLANTIYSQTPRKNTLPQ